MNATVSRSILIIAQETFAYNIQIVYSGDDRQTSKEADARADDNGTTKKTRLNKQHAPTRRRPRSEGGRLIAAPPPPTYSRPPSSHSLPSSSSPSPPAVHTSRPLSGSSSVPAAAAAAPHTRTLSAHKRREAGTAPYAAQAADTPARTRPREAARASNTSAEAEAAAGNSPVHNTAQALEPAAVLVLERAVAAVAVAEVQLRQAEA